MKNYLIIALAIGILAVVVCAGSQGSGEIYWLHHENSLPDGPWVDARRYVRLGLEDAIKAIGTNQQVTLLISKPISINQPQLLEIPTNITLQFLRGGRIEIKSGQTLTIKGLIQAGPHQIFSGNGEVKFGTGTVDGVYAEWWGIDGIEDNIQIKKAIEAGGTGKIHLLDRTYDIRNPIELDPEYDGTILEGNGQERTFLSVSGETLLFSVAVGFQSDLDDGTISEDLREMFENCGFSLSEEEASVSIKKEDSIWLITDKEKNYCIRKEGHILNVYRIINGFNVRKGNLYSSILDLTITATTKAGTAVYVAGDNFTLERVSINGSPHIKHFLCGVQFRDAMCCTIKRCWINYIDGAAIETAGKFANEIQIEGGMYGCSEYGLKIDTEGSGWNVSGAFEGCKYHIYLTDMAWGNTFNSLFIERGTAWSEEETIGIYCRGRRNVFVGGMNGENTTAVDIGGVNNTIIGMKLDSRMLDGRRSDIKFSGYGNRVLYSLLDPYEVEWGGKDSKHNELIGCSHRRKLLFSVDALGYQKDLDNGIISESEGLWEKFRDEGFTLSKDAPVSVVKKDSEWRITDKNEKYLVRKEGDKLNIYLCPFAHGWMVISK